MTQKNKTRAERMSDALGSMSDGLEQLKTLQEEMESWRDNMPENLQAGEKYQEIDECATALEEIVSDIESAMDDANGLSFPGAR